jgi:hypothetical protein
MYSELLDLIPIRFRANNPAAQHSFSILSPRIWSCRGSIGPCVRLVVGKEVVDIDLSSLEEQSIKDALSGLASLGKNGRRDTKYLELYKVVELLNGPRTPEQTAFRHYLAHSPSTLTRKVTVQTLHRLFGGLFIDWDGHSHQRIFWNLFGELLITADETLGLLLRKLPSVEAVDEYKY